MSTHQASLYITTNSVTYIFKGITVSQHTQIPCAVSSALCGAAHRRLISSEVKCITLNTKYFTPYTPVRTIRTQTTKQAPCEILTRHLIRAPDRIPCAGLGFGSLSTHSGRKTGEGWRGSEGEVGKWCVHVEV